MRKTGRYIEASSTFDILVKSVDVQMCIYYEIRVWRLDEFLEPVLLCFCGRKGI